MRAMRHGKILTAALVAATLASALPAAAQGAARLPRAKLLACQQAPAQGDRFMTVQGAMRNRRGAARMGIRFDLLQKLPGLQLQAVQAPGLGVWNVSAPGRSSYRYTKRIENLAAPANYRVIVRFRWYNAKGAVIAHARRVTRACRQPDYRPDLRLRNPDVQPSGQSGTARYEVGVINLGRTLASNFDVLLTVNGAQQPAVTVQQLTPGVGQRVSFVAPRCQAGTVVSFTADPDNRVDERNESNDALELPCPASA
jgi:CARDB protein